MTVTGRFVVSTVTTAYCFYWDVVMDWGLGHLDVPYFLLRSELYFQPTTYYSVRRVFAYLGMIELTRLLLLITWRNVGNSTGPCDAAGLGSADLSQSDLLATTSRTTSRLCGAPPTVHVDCVSRGVGVD